MRPHRISGTAVTFDATASASTPCPEGTWSTDLSSADVRPPATDTPGINPNIDRPLRGTVHDPTARRMGGVRLAAPECSRRRMTSRRCAGTPRPPAGRTPSPFPLRRSTPELMTTPQQPASTATRNSPPNAATPLPSRRPPTPKIPLCTGVPRPSPARTCAAWVGTSTPINPARAEMYPPHR